MNPMLMQMLQQQMPQMGQRPGMGPPGLLQQPQAQQPPSMMQNGMGLLMQGMRNQPGMPPMTSQPMNQAADLMAGGQYPDPLLRMAARAPTGGDMGGGLLTWLRGMFG